MAVTALEIGCIISSSQIKSACPFVIKSSTDKGLTKDVGICILPVEMHDMNVQDHFSHCQHRGNNGHSLDSRKVLSLIQAYTLLSPYASVPPVDRSSMECVFMCADVVWSDSQLYFAQKLQQSRMKALWRKKWISTVAIAASFWMIQILAHKFETWS